jgi:hypothetical protein
MMRTLSTMVVVGVVEVVRMNPGSEMMVEREGGQKGNAEGWKARSISSLANQSINKINKKRTNDHVYHSSHQRGYATPRTSLESSAILPADK